MGTKDWTAARLLECLSDNLPLSADQRATLFTLVVDREKSERTVMERTKVFEAIDSERYYQDRKWGALAERPHEVGGWLALMDVHLHRAKAAWAGANNDAEALEALRKVLAIGVACAEQHGIPSRSRSQPVSERMRAGGFHRTQGA